MEATIGALSKCRKIIILGPCCLSLLIVSMDSTIGLASLLMLSRAAGDRLGRRKIWCAS
ncbi:hypothetical protein HNP40_002924 [Mycobacteroides chelonae]|nr:hypothetical protein [Mycobacteroides chelonae]